MRSIRSYQREIRKLKEILELIQFHQQRYNGYATCPDCEASQEEGHTKDCGLAKAIISLPPA